MGTQEGQGYCPSCQRQVLGRRNTPSHVLHFLIAFFTCGLWLLVWLYLGSKDEPYRCPACGSALTLPTDGGRGLGLMLAGIAVVMLLGAVGAAWLVGRARYPDPAPIAGPGARKVPPATTTTKPGAAATPAPVKPRSDAPARP